MVFRNHRAARLAVYSAALAASATFVAPARAQSTISYSGGTYTQSFDGLPVSGTFTLTGNGPHDLQNAPISATNLEGWSLVKYDGSGLNATFFVDAGTNTSGGVRSYGTAGVPERALGSLGSGTVRSRFGAIFVNTGPSALNTFNLSFIGEQWRRGSALANTLSFEYAVNATDINSGSFVTAPGLNFTAPNTSGANAALNGNDPGNRTAISGTVGGFSWLPGQSLVIRWTDVDDGGSDDGLGIDDLSFSAFLARNLVWNPAGPGGNTWSTSPASMNWLDGGSMSSFTNGDVANFTNDGVGQIIVGVGGVQPGATNFSHESGTYGLVGSAIGGGGALTKTGNGILLFDNENTYTGGTVINGGEVLIKFDSNLGAPTGGITMGGGLVRTLGSINSIRNITLTDATNNTIDTQGPNNATFGGVSGNGNLVKQGTGVLTFTGGYASTGETSVLAGTMVLAQPSGTVNLKTGASGTNFGGDLTVVNGIRVNLNGGDFSGGGKIRLAGNGAILSTDGAQQFLTPTVGNDLMLNSNSLPAPFATTIGATLNNSITFNGVISGASDVSFSSSTPGAGTGVIVLNDNNTWTGVTTVNFAQAGVVRLGTTNALPTGTDLVFGTGANNAGALDLAGFNQSVASLRSDTSGVVNGIANTAATLQGGPSTLTVTGSAITTFSGTIGVPPNTTNLPGANDNIALVLAASHSGELTLTAQNTYAGGTTINGGALGILADNNLGGPSSQVNFGGGTLRMKAADVASARTINVGPGGGTVDTAGFNAQLTGSISGPGSLAKAGAGQLSINRLDTGGLNVIQDEVKLLPGPGPSHPTNVSRVGVLLIAGGPAAPTARIDLSNNAMIIGVAPADGGPEVEGNVRDYLSAGYAGGSWSGQGMTSTQTDLGEGTYGLGYAQASLVNITQFLGVSVDPTDTLVRFTLYGDANIDGQVNLPDFNRLAANFGATDATWRQGDFNYDSFVNLADFNRLAGNFGLVAGPDGPTPEDWAALAAAVPEPVSLGWLAMAGGALLARRRPR